MIEERERAALAEKMQAKDRVRMKLISTRMHGVLDYVTSGALVVLSQVTDWSPRVSRLLALSGINNLTYSLVTDYELGIYRRLPMIGHLALDTLSAATILGMPVLWDDEKLRTKAALIVIGLYEVSVVLMTELQPREENR